MVEAINARVKQWRFFDKVMPNTLLSVVSDYFSIVCALMNRFLIHILMTQARMINLQKNLKFA